MFPHGVQRCHLLSVCLSVSLTRRTTTRLIVCNTPTWFSRRFLWKQFQFIVFRGQVNHLLQTCFTAWRYQRTTPPSPLRLFAPMVSLPQCLQLLRDFENGVKLENGWDERVMRHLLLNPAPSARVLAAQARVAQGLPIDPNQSVVAAAAAETSTGAGSARAGSPPRTASPARSSRGFSMADSLARMHKMAEAAAVAAASAAAIAAGGSLSPSRRSLNPSGQPRRASEQMAASFGVSDIGHGGPDTPLHAAADEGDDGEVRRLLQLGYDPNARNHKLQVCIHARVVRVHHSGCLCCGSTAAFLSFDRM
jgi:hypothetical protein